MNKIDTQTATARHPGLTALLSGVAGGVFALTGILLYVNRGAHWQSMLSVILFAPMVEELLKQSGTLWILEKRPGTIRKAWQIFAAGAVAALTTATAENLVYSQLLHPESAFSELALRWAVCLAMHLLCTTLASLGMWRGWRKMNRDHSAFDFKDCGAWLLTAIALHGGYNLLALFSGSALLPPQ